MKITQSRVNLWRKCHHAHYLRHVENLKLKRKERPLVFGTIVHRMIEAEANGKDPFQELDDIAKREGRKFIQERELYGDLIEDVRCIMNEYYDYYKDANFTYIKKDGKYAEHNFEVEVKGITIAGKIDALARTGQGTPRNWLVEHKTSGNAPPNDDHRWRNLQSSVYIRVIDMLGWRKIDGTMWDYVRSKSPTKPQVLKDGTLSQRDIDTLPSRVRQVIRANGFRDGDYAALINKAIANRKNYFQRIFSNIKKPVVDLLFADFMIAAREIVDKGEKSQDRSIGRHCEWCEFEPLCRGVLQGLDVDFIREREYEKHDPDAYLEGRSVTTD